LARPAARLTVAFPPSPSRRPPLVLLASYCAPQKQGYVSRAAFKLLEIQKKHKVIRQGGLGFCGVSEAKGSQRLACPGRRRAARLQNSAPKPP
jgi:hypothetical protein